ncbi:uncharacterized protein [Canis lupus baileyi]|uniref:uncharacterized protein n=1 Tax=Canis lupus baileyi TaxID=143281 RepID=UPI003B96AB0C
MIGGFGERRSRRPMGSVGRRGGRGGAEPRAAGSRAGGGARPARSPWLPPPPRRPRLGKRSLCRHPGAGPPCWRLKDTRSPSGTSVWLLWPRMCPSVLVGRAGFPDRPGWMLPGEKLPWRAVESCSRGLAARAPLCAPAPGARVVTAQAGGRGQAPPPPAVGPRSGCWGGFPRDAPEPHGPARQQGGHERARPGTARAPPAPRPGPRPALPALPPLPPQHPLAGPGAPRSAGRLTRGNLAPSTRLPGAPPSPPGPGASAGLFDHLPFCFFCNYDPADPGERATQLPIRMRSSLKVKKE